MNNNNYTNRFLITTLIMLIFMMSVTNQTLAQEAYAILDATGTLTFKYDNNKPESGAYSFTDILKGYGFSSEAKKVVFDDSFRDYTPKNCCYLFYHFSKLEEIIGMKENLNTENVTNMSYMFYGCSKLSTIDLSDFNTANVTDMSSMFYGCQNLKAIFVSDSWNTDLVTNYSKIFGNNSMLYGSKGTRCETDDILYARIDEGVDKPGYFTRKGDDPFIPEIYDINGTYQIENADNLLWFANYVNSGNSEAEASLKNNIVLNENLLDRIASGDIDDLVSWIPIGTKNNPFKGHFSCNSYSISGLYVNNPEMDYVGLFGFVSTNAWLNNVVVNDSYFVGSNFVGGICGYTEKSINTCRFSGRVSGKQYVGGICGKITTSTYQINTNTVLAEIVGDDYVGGLYGYSEGPTSYECYFRGHIIGKQYVGGLCGQAKSTNQSIFSSCYVSAEIDGDDLVGSICGDLDDNNYCSSCYYDTEMCTVGAINGKDDIEHDVIGSNGFHTGRVTWLMKSFRQDLSDNNSFPEIEGPWVHKNLDGNGYHNPEYEDGHCKHCINYTYTLPKLEDGVYQISNADELYGFMNIVNSGNTHANAILTQDIVVNENVLEKVKSGETLDLREWYSIGDGGYLGYHDIKGGFAGVLDGNFHTISGLYFNNKVIEDQVQVGFVGILHGTIKNIIVTDTYFESITSVSGIACYMNQMSADNSIFNANPVIENCIFDGEINSNGSAAGICYSHSGDDDGTIKNCINYGKISGSSYSGGILGAAWNTATIINCYNVGEIIRNDKKGTMYGGGIYGGTNGGSISSCFNTGLISFDYSVCGYHWGNLTISDTYNNQDVCNLPLTSSDNTTITGGGQTTSDYLCNGELPEGFSSSDWIPGKTETDGDVTFYTFPHLKVFDGIYPAYTFKKEPQAVAITLTTPTKTEYFEKENLDLTGCELLVSYDNSKTEKVELSNATISGFDNTKLGEQTIKVSYLDLETEFKVTVVAFAPVSIDISKLPIKLQYLENEELNINDGELLITYNDNTTEKVALNKAIISGFDKTKIGEQTLTVVFYNLETTFNVNVKAKTAIALEITATPSKLEYFEGEAFVADGGEFVVTYDNKTSETFSLSKAKISGYNANLIGKQNLTVEYLGQKAELKVTIKYKNPYTEPAVSAEDNFYQISTAEELFWFMFDVNHGDVKANAALVNDIIINKDCLKRITEMLKATSKAASVFTPWQPIGTTENPYQGTFDGQGHTISGIYIDDNTQSNVGLFGSTAKDAVIKNLGVTDSYIAGNENVGAICGKAEGTVVNCYTVSEVKGNKNVSELIGNKTTEAVIENCYYLAEEPNINNPCAKTAEEFKSGKVATLLSQGATINGVTYSGDSFAGITELPGTDIIEVIELPENTDNPSTAVAEISKSIIRIWSYGSTVYIENAESDIYIVNLNGSLITKCTPESSHIEINLNNKGVYIVKTGNSTQKIVIQ